MGRPVRVDDYIAKRKEILDAGLRLTLSKGYEQMSIQDILEDLSISKGAFFHYFVSKAELLEAIVDRVLEEGLQKVASVAQDLELPALERIRRLFSALVGWNTSQKAFFLAMLQVWYGDDNAIVRQKVRAKKARQMGSLLTQIIRDGIQEGVFTVPYSDQLAEVALCLVENMVDTLAGQLLAHGEGNDSLQLMQITVNAYTGGLERVLGAPSRSVTIIDEATLKEWLTSSEDEI
jgi:AcrR family transcriptional regulator